MAAQDAPPRNFCHTPWARFGGEVLGSILVLAAAIISSSGLSPAPLTFIERDPSLSFQLTLPETVSTGQLIAICLIIPIGFFALIHTAQAIHGGLCGWAGFKSVFVSLAWLLLAFAQCCIVGFAVTGCIKIAVGRPRPNFFALCDYQGYRAAQQTGNMTSYFAATVPGVFGSISRCLATAGEVTEAQRSFPSGHASFSFSAMMFLTLYLRAIFFVPNATHFSTAAVLASAPLVLATFVAISRVRDRWHNTDDISVGAFIGIVSALVAWRHYRSLRRMGLIDTRGVVGKLGDEEGSPAARALLDTNGGSRGGSPAGSPASAIGNMGSASSPAVAIAV